MNVVMTLLVVAPLVAAGLNMALWRFVRLQQVIGSTVLGGMLVTSLLLLRSVSTTGAQVVELGAWKAPVGIVLVADTFSALLLVIAIATLLAVFVYAIGQPRADKSAFYFHSLYLILATGVACSFLAGDFFNLFVAIEITLTASYVLITLGGSKAQIRSGMTYVIINMIASTLLLVAIGLVYAATGSVNMADVSDTIRSIPDGIHQGIAVMLLVALGIKAAIFPLFFWLPDSYPTAPVTVTAVFAGLLTKIGMYGILRTQTLLLWPSESSTLLLVLATLTMVVGALGALAQNDMKRILSFSIVSQIGYILFGLGINTAAGVAAAIFFLLHQIPVKTSLFLVAGLVETISGSASLDRVSGLMRRSPFTAAMFGLCGLSLIGLPPLSGFFGKLALVEAGFDSGQWVVTGVSLAVSLLTLMYLTKVWAQMFWGAPTAPEPIRLGDGRVFELPERAPRLMNAATLGLVVVTVVIAVAAEPIWAMCLDAAGELAEPSNYVRAVLGR